MRPPSEAIMAAAFTAFFVGMLMLAAGLPPGRARTVVLVVAAFWCGLAVVGAALDGQTK